MCGICGWFNKKGNIDAEVVRAMNNIAKHRGPDDEGYVLVSDGNIVSYIGEDSMNLPYANILDYTGNSAFLAFGHRRLSIIDLSSQGHQPMLTEDGELCITFNGEIYNYIEVRDILEAHGYKFRSSSDTEVLLNAYRYWGEDCVQYLNGMWGFAIWDNKKRTIFCSRDRLGAKPFHYYMDENNFLFASEMKQLIQNPLVTRKMNEKILTAFMMWPISDFSDETLIQDVKTLRGGYNLSYTLPQKGISEKAQFRIYSYWDIDTDGEKEINAVKETFKCHENAVKIRTRSDVPIGIMLSGGLDSSVLVTEVTEYLKDKIDPAEINTYTSCYKDYPQGDERKYAEAVNKFCGTRQNLIYPDEDDTFSTLAEMIWHMEGLVEFASMGGFLTLREVAKSGVKVIINGQGSDETMFGYERYYSWYLKDVKKKRGIGAFLKEFYKASSSSALGIKQMLLLYFYFGNPKIRRLRCRLRMQPYISDHILNQFDINRDIERFINFKDLKAMQYNELRGTQLTHILRMDDRCYMAFSMESRVPFIDYRYIEAAVKIPEDLKIRDGYTKYLLRKHIEGKLPDEVVWRKNKMGWPSPRERWIKRLDKKRVEELFENPRCRNYFNVGAVRKLWKKDPYAFAVEKFLCVELFMRLFDVEAAGESSYQKKQRGHYKE